MTMKDCTKLVRHKRTASIAISEMQICILSKTHLHHRDRICDGPNVLAHSIMYFYSVLASPRELKTLTKRLTKPDADRQTYGKHLQDG
jgi:hypothetical protein